MKPNSPIAALDNVFVDSGWNIDETPHTTHGIVRRTGPLEGLYIRERDDRHVWRAQIVLNENSSGATRKRRIVRIIFGLFDPADNSHELHRLTGLGVDGRSWEIEANEDRCTAAVTHARDGRTLLSVAHAIAHDPEAFAQSIEDFRHTPRDTAPTTAGPAVSPTTLDDPLTVRDAVEQFIASEVGEHLDGMADQAQRLIDHLVDSGFHPLPLPAAAGGTATRADFGGGHDGWSATGDRDSETVLVRTPSGTPHNVSPSIALAHGLSIVAAALFAQTPAQ